MPSLWRRVVRSKKDLGERSTSSASPRPSTLVEQYEDVTANAETRLHYLNSGQAMRLLRQVHLVDPVQSPSWSGVQRSTPDSPSILHLIEEEEEEAAKLAEKSELLLLPGIVEITNDPNVLSVRGLLLDSIRHIGPVIDHSNADEQTYRPPKWLSKLAAVNKTTAIFELPFDAAAHPPRMSKSAVQAALQEKYDDFMAYIYSVVSNQHKAVAARAFDHVKMCVTTEGYFGLVPASARSGDAIFMVERDALKTIFLVRKHPVHGFFLWNGSVYMHSLAPIVDNTHATTRIFVG